jgi:X-linked retinitis pigmentosa GTPase regulator
MQLNKFDLNEIYAGVEEVIQKGLNKILNKYMDRYNLLEETHQKIMSLPLVVNELKNRCKNKDCSDCDSECHNNNDNSTFYTSKYNYTNSNYDDFSKFEKRLEKMEKKNDVMCEILEKLLSKVAYFNEEILQIKVNSQIKEIENTSFIENENIEINIEEESEQDDEVFNPVLVTSSVNLFKQETEEFEETDELEQEEDELEEEDIEETDELEEEEEQEEEETEETEEQEKQETDELEEEETDEQEEETDEQEEQEKQETEEQEEQTETEELEEEETEEQEEEVPEINDEIETEASEELEEEKTDELEEEEEEEEEEIFEIEIDDKTYCTNDDKNGFIWELTDDGEQGEKVGYFKDEEPFFYADEN